ncbi:MMPL family transporter [Kitasatospora paracochleata]|uniref:RND superfamily putative drug exporter n=1 Tax=Kitasatospora paracochleata TaxID=58354 RepID=A0ABT1J577_9ACTN|nr:MMPL family transporter [Kitasatospora paracochleata]MCP2312582.1 RND superfamily putative drug exporter [Kitasatospora paracochleata]
MFHRIGQFVVKRAWWVIAAWLVAMLAIVATAPTITAQTDEAAFLPKSYESIQAAELQAEKFPASFTPGALLLFERTDGGALGAADQDSMAKIVQGLTDKHIALVEQILPVGEKSLSQDHKYALTMVSIDKTKMQTDEYGQAAKDLRTEGTALASGTGLKFQVGGQAAQALDQKESSGSADAIIFVASIVLVMMIVGIIFRSILAGLLPVLLSLVVAMPVANGLIADATKLLDLKTSSVTSAILIVVLLGVGTDYFLFLMFRYRERLRAGDAHKEAVANGVGRVGEAIASAAGAVAVAFAVLVLSSLGMFTALGPALAIAVVVAALASLTLAPAVLSVIPARATFWPGKSWMNEPSTARFAALGRMTQKRPGLVAAVSGGLLVVLSVAALGYSGTFDLAGSSMPKDKESMVVQDKLMTAFSAGAADPSHVFVTTTGGGALDRSALTGYADKLGKVPGVAQAPAEPKISTDGTTADFTVTLKDSPSSNAAIDTVSQLRKVAHAEVPSGTKALVGGQSSVLKDINLAMAHDYKVVFPLAGALILLILALQLRSVVAPWYLMASVGLGFAGTLGATTLVFQKLGNEPGLMFMLPIFIYLFVVAIGTDYNILIIARLREEAREGRSPREAAREAVKHGGPTVAAAGFILAASFATFMLAGNVLFMELGFALAFGIVLAAFVMAMFFTPALTALLGRAAWWPGHGAMAGHGPAEVELGKREPESAGLR